MFMEEVTEEISAKQRVLYKIICSAVSIALLLEAADWFRNVVEVTSKDVPCRPLVVKTSEGVQLDLYSGHASTR